MTNKTEAQPVAQATNDEAAPQQRPAEPWFRKPYRVPKSEQRAARPATPDSLRELAAKFSK